MLNLNEELTYYKSKDFINYMLGVYKHEGEHDTYENMEVLLCSPWGFDKCNVNYDKRAEREMLSRLIYDKIKADEGAFSLFRCDFDFGISPIKEEEHYMEDYLEILACLKMYCSLFDTYGFTVSHFDQQKEDNEELFLTRHIHLVYKEPVDAPKFSDYLQKMMI